MNYTKRKLHIAWFLLSALFVMFLLTGCEEGEQRTSSYNLKITEATESFYINDFAGIFTEEQKTSMMDKAIDLDSDYAGIQVVITTVESLKDCVIEGSRVTSIEQVAYAMFNQYGIGQDDMGILVLFSSGDRDVRIETGRQMQVYITDSKSGQLLDNYGMEYFKQDQFAEGLISLQDGIISEIKAVVPSDWNASQEQEKVHDTKEVRQPENFFQTQENTAKEPAEKQDKGGVFVFLAVIGSIVVGLIVSIVQLFNTKGKLKASQNENKHLDQKLVLQKEDNERKLQQVQEQHKQELDKTEQRYIQERASLEREIQACRREANLCKEQVEQTKEAAEAKQCELERKINDLENEKSELRIQKQELQEKFERAQRLHPELDFEAEVQEMIEKEFQEAAEKIDGDLAKYLTTPASDGAEQYFESAITCYHSVAPEVQKYLRTDIQKLQSLYNESRILHWKALAAEADKKLGQYLIMTADKDNVRAFERAIREYDSCQPEMQRYMTTDRSQLSQMYKESLLLKQKFEREEQEKKDKAEAQRICDTLRRVLRNNPKGTYQNEQELEEACRKYDCMTLDVRNFFPDSTIIQTLRKLLREAEEDTLNWQKAQRAEEHIEGVISRVGYSALESDKDGLERAMRIYRGLTSIQQAYVSIELIRKLERFIEEAEEDERQNRRRREEEQRRRSISSSSMGSSFHSGSFGGHGGRSGGGGASRHF